MNRKEFSAKTKAQAFQRCRGFCEGIVDGIACYAILRPGRWHCDHIIADGLGGKAVLENAQCLCEPCHRDKTSENDVPKISKVKRIQRRASGILKNKSRSWGYGKKDKFKKTIDGRLVPRD